MSDNSDTNKKTNDVHAFILSGVATMPSCVSVACFLLGVATLSDVGGWRHTLSTISARNAAQWTDTDASDGVAGVHDRRERSQVVILLASQSGNDPA